MFSPFLPPIRLARFRHLTNAVQWHTYVGAKLKHQNGAMAVMMNEGKLLKYDALHNNTDTGVLMIRGALPKAFCCEQYHLFMQYY